MREGFLARYEGDAQLLVHLQSLEVCTFEPLLLQVPAHWPTNEPLHVPVHQVSSQLKPQRHRFIVSKSQNISIPDWKTIDMSQAILRLR